MDDDEIADTSYLSTLFSEDLLAEDQCLRGLTGLMNLGNTCYMNSALQALSNCPPLREYFRLFFIPYYESSGDDAYTGHNARPVATAFQDLITQIWGDKQIMHLLPRILLIKIREKCPQFRGSAQQDSQEFIRCFLDVMHQELRRPVKKWEVQFINSCSSTPSASALLESAVSANAADLPSVDADAEDNENFETADSGLSSDTDDSPKTSANYSIGSNRQMEGNTREKIVGYRSVITDVFDGELVSSVKCQTCQHISYTNENFQDISLSIPTMEQLDYMRDSSVTTSSVTNINESKQIELSYGYFYWFFMLTTRWLLSPVYNWFAMTYRSVFAGSITLEQCLKAFFSTDFLHGDDMYSCEKCSKLRNGVKQCKLTKLPEILCIHLKRFRHDNMYNTKINAKVSFPLHALDMRSFVRESVLEKYENVTEYDLVAIISHRGGSIDFGHYIAYCRNESDKNWYEFDDAIVTRVNVLEVMSREAYVLFYQKKNSAVADEVRKQFQLMRCELNNKRIVEVDRFYISKEWLHKFFTFSEPGPINNCDFLCSHRRLTPLYSIQNQLSACVYVTESLWHYLQRRMGGGPICRELIECEKCRRVQNHVINRKNFERKTFEELQSESRYADCFPPNLISLHWMEKWENFIQHISSEPPPAINNEALVRKYKDGNRLRPGSKFMKIHRETWLFLQGIYGGGPELLAVPFNQLTSEEITRHLERIDANRRKKEVVDDETTTLSVNMEADENLEEIDVITEEEDLQK